MHQGGGLKLKIGDNVCHPKYGSGEIVAMSKEWCVYFSDLYQCEIALHWNEVSIPIEPDVLSEGMQEINIGQGEEESEDTDGFCREENQMPEEVSGRPNLSDLQQE
jgi:hypothetical protein